MTKWLTLAQRQQVVALYESGTTLQALAEQFDRDRTAIDRIIRLYGKRRGHKFRPRGKRVFRYYRRDEDKVVRSEIRRGMR